MPVNLKGRSMCTLADYAPDEIAFLLENAAELKRMKAVGMFPKNLANKNIAAIFMKPSCRTRTAFVVAAADEGANLEIFPFEDLRIGIKESVKDVARILGRMFDGIVFRGFSHDTVVELAKYSGVPVWNALCDKYHPTQLLADMQTIIEQFSKLEGTAVTYVGDGRNNIARSLIVSATKMGMDLRILAPKELSMDQSELDHFLSSKVNDKANIIVTEDPKIALEGSAVVYGDAWVSMGEENLIEDRIKMLRPFMVNKELMELTQRKDSIYMHCLPALHNNETSAARENPGICEVSDEIFESSISKVFDQAENRMHTAKAIMVATV